MEADVNIASKEEKDRKEWNSLSKDLGFDPKDFGRKFKYDDKTFVIGGVRKYADVRPIIAYEEGNEENRVFLTLEEVKGAIK